MLYDVLGDRSGIVIVTLPGWRIDCKTPLSLTVRTDVIFTEELSVAKQYIKPVAVTFALTVREVLALTMDNGAAII